MKKIEEIEINGEKIYLKNSSLGWKVIYPIKIDNKINYKHLIAGRSWWNLLVVFIIVCIILGCIFEYSNAVKVANECLNSTITNSFKPNNFLP